MQTGKRPGKKGRTRLINEKGSDYIALVFTICTANVKSESIFLPIGSVKTELSKSGKKEVQKKNRGKGKERRKRRNCNLITGSKMSEKSRTDGAAK